MNNCKKRIKSFPNFSQSLISKSHLIFFYFLYRLALLQKLEPCLWYKLVWFAVLWAELGCIGVRLELIPNKNKINFQINQVDCCESTYGTPNPLKGIKIFLSSIFIPPKVFYDNLFVLDDKQVGL